MGTVILYANGSACVNYSNASANYSSSNTYSFTSSNPYDLVLGFESFPEDLAFKPITALRFYIYMTNNASTSSYSQTADLYTLNKQIDIDSVTYNDISSTKVSTYTISYRESANSYLSFILYASTVKKIIEYGALFSSVCTFYTNKGKYKPYVEIEYDDASAGLNITGISPASGAYAPKNQKIDVTFSTKAESTNCYEAVVQASCKLQYRLNETSTIYSVSGTTENTLSIPASRVTGSQIQYKISVTSNSGVTTESDWITLSTAEAAGSSIAKYPQNTIIDGSVDNTFSWDHVIATGTAQTAFDLQISQDNETWITLRSMTTSETSVVIPANTLTGGDLYWRVRTYNTDGVAGEWSEAAHCIVVAAPDAPLISIVDAAPRFSIRWQQSGQQGYEIMLDGQRIAKKWGETSSYQYDGYLTPGTYTVQVRIQNKYGLWSDWGTAALPIANTEGAEIVLTANQGQAVILQWNTTEAYDAYLIYRDGQLIGRTRAMTFTDHFALGVVVYEVRGVYEAAGNYTLSNAVTVEASVDVLMISSVKDPAWQQIPLSASSLRSRSHSATQSVTYLHYTRTALPSAEIGEALDKTYRFDAAFPQTEKAAADAFEALIGKLVCVKDPDGYRIFGILGTHSLTSNPFYRSYNCTVTLVDWKEGAGL